MDRQRNRSYALLQELGLNVVRGDYDQEKRFPTSMAICEQFNVSRIIAREVTKMLESKGMLGSVRIKGENCNGKRGIWVQPQSDWNLFDKDILNWILECDFSLNLLKEFNEARLAIDPSVAFFSATNADRKNVKEIGIALDLLDSAFHGFENTLRAEKVFHTSLLEACKNRFYFQFKDFNHASLEYNQTFREACDLWPIQEISMYEKIFDAIATKQPDKAKFEMRVLINSITPKKKMMKTAFSNHRCIPTPKYAIKYSPI